MALQINSAALELTCHAARRAAQRNLSPRDICYVVTHGRRYHRTGVVFFSLGRKDVPPSDRSTDKVMRLEGTVIVVSTAGEVLTVYRNRRSGRGQIRRKLKYHCPELQC